MKRVFVLCGFGALITVLTLPFLGVGIAQAVLIEIPIPEFIGIYDETNFGDNSAALPFIYDPAEITTVSIRLTGSSTAGIAVCSGEFEPWPIDVFSYIGNYSGNEFWTASPDQLLEDGSFEVVMVFENFPNRPETWNLLADGNGIINMAVSPTYLLGICTSIDEPTIQIDEFVVIFDMASVVPVERTTWDCIKAQYR